MARWQDKNWVNRMTIRLDYSQMMSEFIGDNRGITETEIDELAPQAKKIVKDIDKKRDGGELGFYKLPYNIPAADQVLELVDTLKQRCDDLVVLGIGGSALGGIALFHSLCHPLHNLLPKVKRGGPRAFFLDNVDPVTCRAVIDKVNPEKTIFAVITKSGNTVETISQFLVIRRLLEDKLGKAAVAEHLVVITDDKPNALRDLSQAADYPVLSVPANVGGRYSVLSPVGLFPAAMLGIDIFELLAGARYMAKRCESNSLQQNPAYLAGALHYLADKKKGLNIAVIMSYCDALQEMAFWFRQLWAESLGKAKTLSGATVHAGQTPVVALGATDQHSQLQLYMEGPFDKMVTFLIVEKYGANLPIPRVTEKEYAYLGRHTFEELINIEAQATQLALTKAGRSSMSLTLPEVNPFTIGQLFFLFEVQTVFAGGLYNINPLDQPGVESGKRYIQGILGRPGFEDKAKEVKDWQQKKERYII